jgi:2'-5' RNA ligase
MELASLKEYAKHKDGTYVSFEMTQESKDLLDHFVEMNLGLTERVDKKTYHITVIYSRTPVPAAEKFKETGAQMSARAEAYEVFPTKSDGKCLVMRMVCPAAAGLNATLTGLGATSSYGEYKPHVTIAYNITQEVDVHSMPVPQFPLIFDVVNVAPLDPEFTPENKK